MPRVYVRKFDWDEARRLREDDSLTYYEIGKRLGVSSAGVKRVLNPETRKRMQETSDNWIRSGNCPECFAPTTRYSKDESALCRDCWAKAIGTSARESELRCVTCRKWLPDKAFAHNRHENGVRRGRHTNCRACNTSMKRDWREQQKVPCSHGCGTYVEGRGRRDPSKPPECHPCAMARLARERRRRAA